MVQTCDLTKIMTLINGSSGAGSILSNWRMLFLSSVYKSLHENWKDISEYFLSFPKVKHLIGDLPEGISYLFFKKEKKIIKLLWATVKELVYNDLSVRDIGLKILKGKWCFLKTWRFSVKIFLWRSCSRIAYAS